jgi:hypothetical protein
MDFLKMYANNSPLEWGLAVQHDPYNNSFWLYNIAPPGSSPQYINSGTPNSVSIGYSENTYLIAHTHPDGSNPAPSPSDAIFLANAYKYGNATNITANVMYGKGGTEYMIYVDNRQAFQAFCNSPSNSGFFNRSGSMFASGSVWANAYNAAYNNMKSKGYSDNDAQSYALMHVLDSYGTGLKVYEKKNGSFKQQKTELSGNNYSPKICQ